MKLVVEYDKDGTLYVYRETEKHHKKVEKNKTRPDYPRLTLKDLDENCQIEPGTIIIADLK